MTTTLLPNRQLHAHGLTLGIISLKPDPADPAVLLGIGDPAGGEPLSFRLRPGESVDVRGTLVRVLEVTPNPDGSVVLDVAPATEDER